MRNKWLLYLVLFMLAANAALVTTLLIKNNSAGEEEVEFSYKHRNKFQGKSHAKFENHLSEELGLDEDQQQKIKVYSREFHDEQKAHRYELFGLRKEYFNALSQANPDTAALNEIASEIGAIEALKTKLEYMHYRNMRSVCNKEQAIKMDSLGRMHMHQRFKNRGSEGKCRQKHSGQSRSN